MTRDEYLRWIVQRWLDLPAGACPPVLPNELAALLLRDEERLTAHRDPWDNWEFPFSEVFRRGTLLAPEIDTWAASCPGRRPLWPDGHKFALAISHDVDDVSHRVTPAQWWRRAKLALGGGAKAAIRSLPGTVWQARTLSPTPDTDPTIGRLLDIERELAIPASWFFTVWPPARPHLVDCVHAFADPCRFRGRRATVADVIRAVADCGHEVGLHGSYVSAIDGPALVAEKTALDGVLGQPTTSIRQHWLHWRVDTTPHLQAAAGFTVDGTLGFNNSAGFRCGTSLPFPWWDGGPLDILMVPVSVMDVALFRPGDMGLDLTLALRLVDDIIQRVEASGGILSLLIHPNHIIDPRVETLLRHTVGTCWERGALLATHADIRRSWDLRVDAQAAQLGAKA
jgi:peptidoglycan/xylan/chitin deacetylase (PgdA/CDA1 family)